MKTFSTTPGNERKRVVCCPVCGSTESRNYAVMKESVFLRCSSCGLVYQNPQPLQEDLSLRYDTEYFDYERANEEIFYNLMRLGLEDVGFQKLSVNLPSPRYFLDVGCATGRLLEALRGEGWETAGVELCEPSAEYGRTQRSLNIVIGTLEKAAFPDESFHVVHASHLVEHLTEPNLFLKEIFRILVPQGFLILATPNTAGFQARLFGQAWRSLIEDHICLFSKSNLTLLLRKEGFVLHTVKTWGGLAQGTAPKFLKTIADRGAKRFGFGDVMIVLAQKQVPGGY